MGRSGQSICVAPYVVGIVQELHVDGEALQFSKQNTFN